MLQTCVLGVVVKMTRFFQSACAALVLVLASMGPSRAMPVEVPQDVVFVFDGSGSLNQSGFDTIIEFMQDIVDTQSGNPVHPIRFGAILFSSDVETVYNLTDNQTPSLITGVLENVLYPAGTTHTRDALFAAITMFDEQSDELNPKTLLLITDGAPVPTRTQSVCQDFRMKNNLDAADVQVNIVGVGAGYDPDPVACLVDDTDAQIVEITDFSNDFDFQRGYVQGVVAMPAPGMVAILAFGIAGIAAVRRRG